MVKNEVRLTQLITVLLVLTSLTSTLGIVVYSFNLKKTSLPAFQPINEPKSEPDKNINNNSTQSIMKDSKEMINVSFCEKYYRSRTITINNVNIIKRISEIAYKDAEKNDMICKNLNSDYPDHFNIESIKQDQNDLDYYFYFGGLLFRISENRIDMVKKDGSSIFFGNLIDDSNFPKNVSFCGKFYKTNGAVINNVEIVNRIAEVASKDSKDKICENIIPSLNNDIINAKALLDNNGKDYYVTIEAFQFKISAGKIYIADAYSGNYSFYATIK